MRRAWIGVAGVCLEVLAGGAIAGARPISAADLQATVAQALRQWRAGMEAHGLVGQQAESEACFKTLEHNPSQRQAAVCVSLDHFSLLDAMNYPEALRPPYFSTDAVFARLDKAVARTTAPAERQAFASRLLTTLDETIHNSKR
jgi:hypothetical protein